MKDKSINPVVGLGVEAMNVIIIIPSAEEGTSVCLPAGNLLVIMAYVVVCEKETKTIKNKRTNKSQTKKNFHVVNVSHVDKKKHRQSTICRK